MLKPSITSMKRVSQIKFSFLQANQQSFSVLTKYTALRFWINKWMNEKILYKFLINDSRFQTLRKWILKKLWQIWHTFKLSKNSKYLFSKKNCSYSHVTRSILNESLVFPVKIRGVLANSWKNEEECPF